MKSDRPQLFAALEMVVAASFWGFGFIAVIWAFESLGAFHITFLRFIIAFVPGVVILARKQSRLILVETLKLSAIPALLLTGTLIFQTLGLKYTTATKSGFITTLYVIFVPIFDAVIHRRIPPFRIWICVGVATVGTLLIVGFGSLLSFDSSQSVWENFNIGDMLTLICALFATGQIWILSRIGGRVKSPLVFNILQSGWVALFASPFLFFEPRELIGPNQWTLHAWGGILALAFGSTAVSFFLQVRAQAKLSATVSSILCLLESPFALIFSFFLLGERLGPLEALGATMIFFAAVFATIFEAQGKKF